MKARFNFYRWMLTQLFFIGVNTAIFLVCWAIVLIWTLKPNQIYSTRKGWMDACYFITLSKHWRKPPPPEEKSEPDFANV